MSSKGILNTLFYGNFVRQWLIALGVLVVVFALLLLLRSLICARLEKVAKRTSNLVDDLALEIVKGTRPWFLFALALMAAAQMLLLAPRPERAFVRLVKLVALVQAALWAATAVSFWVQTHLDRRRSAGDLAGVSTIRALGIGAKIIAWIIAFITALATYGVNIAALVTGLGVGGIAIALAVQNILGDLLAALAIIFDKPFEIGDTIVVDTMSGTVEHIGLKTTRIRSTNGEQIIVSNSELLKSRIRNYRCMYERRVAFTTDVSYDTSEDTAKRIPQIIREAVDAQTPIRFERSHFAAYTDSALRFETVYWVLDPDYGKHMDIQQAINLRLLARFKAESIEFAYPTRAIHLKGAGLRAEAPGA